MMQFHGNSCEDSSLQGAYHLIRRVGSGSQGQAFLVRERVSTTGLMREDAENLGVLVGPMRSHVKERRDWVVKVVDLSSDPKERAARISEASTMLSLSHPCIVGCKESAVHDSSKLCIVMEFCREGDLRAKIRQQQNSGKPFSESQILDWFLQLALALEYLHRRKILHRDVKSENVFLRGKNDFPPGNAATVQLGDFGTARTLDTTQALAQTMVGTPVYMSPEILQGQTYNHKSDIWSLGCILYEMMCFKHPFQGSNLTELTYHVLFSSYDPPSEMYSKELRHLLSSLLAEEAIARPTASAILTLPILRSRAAHFLTACQDTSALCLKERGPLILPIYKRCLDIHQTAMEQARRVGLHLSLSSDNSRENLSKHFASQPFSLSGSPKTPQRLPGGSVRSAPVSPLPQSPVAFPKVSQGEVKETRRIGLHLSLSSNDTPEKRPKHFTSQPFSLSGSPKTPQRLAGGSVGSAPASPLPQSPKVFPKLCHSDVKETTSPSLIRSSRVVLQSDTHSSNHGARKGGEGSLHRVTGSPKYGTPCEMGPSNHKWEAHPLPSPPPAGKATGVRRLPGRLAVEVSGKSHLEMLSGGQGSPNIGRLRSSSSDSDIFGLASAAEHMVKSSRRLSARFDLSEGQRSEGRKLWNSKEKRKQNGHRATKSMDFLPSGTHQQSWVPPPFLSKPGIASPRFPHKVSARGMPPKSPTSSPSWNPNSSSVSSPQWPRSPGVSPRETGGRDGLASRRSRKTDKLQIPSFQPVPPKTASPSATSPKTKLPMRISNDTLLVRESRRRRWSCPAGTDADEGVKEIIKEVVMEDLALAFSNGNTSNNRWDFVKSRLADPDRQGGGNNLQSGKFSLSVHSPLPLADVSEKCGSSNEPQPKGINGVSTE